MRIMTGVLAGAVPRASPIVLRPPSGSKQQHISLRQPVTASEVRKSLTLTESASTGTAALRDCLAAESRMRCSLSGLTTFLSERSPITGTMVSSPNSVAFSANHSKRSMFLVGHTAMVR